MFLAWPNVASGEVAVLTMKGKYGLKALIDLAALEPGEWAMSSEIAGRNAISKKFLDAILGELRSAGFVRTKKGRGGGYRLQRPADEVKVGHALRVIEGPLAPIACASRTAHVPCADCPDETVCAVRLLMLDVRNAITGVLDETKSRRHAGACRARARGHRGAVAGLTLPAAVRP